MNDRYYDAIVLGLGGMGSAVLHQLARRGLRVLGLEQHALGHALGSSHGETRLIRKAYFEHPDYVPLLSRAYTLWHELEEVSGEHLFEDGIGLVMIGPGSAGVLPATLEVARTHALPITAIARDEFTRRFPMLILPTGMDALWDREGGLLYVDRCVRAQIAVARRLGAQIHADEAVRAWKQIGSTVRVETEHGVYETERLVITAGAWSARVLADLAMPLRIVRKVAFWFPAIEPAAFALGKCPTFFFDLPWGQLYGFPCLDKQNVKIADHRGGLSIDAPMPERRLLPGDDTTCVRAVREFFPGLAPEHVRFSTCLYTMTPDENFIVARHPEHDRVTFAAGFSGHGFKFASVMGEILCELALDGRTRHPIDFLRLDRPALRA